MDMITAINYFLYLMIYSFLGWGCESAYISFGRKKFVNSGFMHGPFCPIYGFGAIFVILMLSWLDNYPLLVFILGIIITSLIEYFTSWLLEMLFHIMWWDYSQRKFNINGRVCLRNSFLFGCMSIFVIYFLHPSVSSFVGSISISLRQLIAIVLFLYLVTDIILSTLQLISFKQQLSVFEAKLEEIKGLLSSQIPEFNFNVKEKIESFMENTPEFDDLKKQLYQHYRSLRESTRQARLRNSFPHLKLSNKKQLRDLGEYFRKQYENFSQK